MASSNDTMSRKTKETLKVLAGKYSQDSQANIPNQKLMLKLLLFSGSTEETFFVPPSSHKLN